MDCFSHWKIDACAQNGRWFAAWIATSPHNVRRIPTLVNESSLMARLPIGFSAR
jgi:hypothetical protein